MQSTGYKISQLSRVKWFYHLNGEPLTGNEPTAPSRALKKTNFAHLTVKIGGDWRRLAAKFKPKLRGRYFNICNKLFDSLRYSLKNNNIDNGVAIIQSSIRPRN